MDGAKGRSRRLASLGAVLACLACNLAALPVVAHEQQAISGGKKVQPTPEVVQERIKTHPPREGQPQGRQPTPKPKKGASGDARESGSGATRETAPNRK